MNSVYIKLSLWALGFLAFVCVGGFFFYQNSIAQTALFSAEAYLAEVSPLGAAGGFAVPASAGSGITTTCSFDFAENPVNLNADTNLQITSPNASNSFTRRWSGYRIRRCDLNEYTEAQCLQDTRHWTSLGRERWEVIHENISRRNIPMTFSARSAGLDEGSYIYLVELRYERYQETGTDYNGSTSYNWVSSWASCRQTLNVEIVSQCSDGIDNDGDGAVDWNGNSSGAEADPGCESADDNDETDPLIELFYKQSVDLGWSDRSPIEYTTDFPIDLRWEGDAILSSCEFTSGYNAPTGDVAITGQSLGQTADRKLSNAPGDASTYTIRCEYTEEGTTRYASDSVDMSYNPAAPWISFGVREKGSNTAYRSSITIAPTDQAEVEWQGYNVAECVSADNGFTTGSDRPISGSGVDVVEPTLADGSRFYYLNCTTADGNDTASAAVYVQVTDGPIAGAPQLVANPRIIRFGESVELSWNLNGNNASECTITGPEADTINLAAGTSVELGLTTQARYVLSCPGGSTAVDVLVLPAVSET